MTQEKTVTAHKHPHQLTESVKLLQKVVLLHEGKVLIVKRGESELTRAGKWDLPGGNAEWLRSATEDVRDPHKDDAVREVLEETTISLSRDDISQPCYVGTYFEPSIQNYSIILGWKVLLNGEKPSVQLSDEHSEYRWATLEECQELDWGFAWSEDGFIKHMVETAFS